MNKRNYLIKTSLKKKLKSKWFKGINIFILLLLIITVNISNIINLFGGDFENEKTILVLDDANIYDEFNNNFSNLVSYNASLINIERTYDSLDNLKEKVTSNSNLIILHVIKDDINYLKADIYTRDGISTINRTIISNILGKIKYNLAINDLNLSSEDLQKVNSSIEINTNILESKNNQVNVINDSGDDFNVMSAIVIVIFILPFFFLIVTLVQMIGMEINDEKTNKSMEIIISNVSPKDHLVSKIVACTLFTFIQIFLIFIFIYIAVFIHKLLGPSTTSAIESIKVTFEDFITVDIINRIIKLIPILIIFFIFTLITYAVIAGVLASVTTNIDDFQQLQTPIMLVISLGFYLALMAVIFEGSSFIKVMSFIPLISFLLAPSLYMLGEISIISLIIATIIQGIFAYIVFKYGMKIYRVGILNYSGSHLWKKMYKALRS